MSGNVTFRYQNTSYPLRGVKIVATDNGFETRVTYTDSNGNYVLESFAKQNGKSVTVTPSLQGYKFNPSSKNVQLNKSNQNGINFQAQFSQNRPTYRIEGYITLKDNPLENITVQLIQNGEIVQETKTFSDGFYQFTGLPSGQSYIVAPYSVCVYSFNPSQTEVTIETSDVLDVDFSARKLLYSIYGVILDPNGTPIPNVNVTLSQNTQITLTDSEGRYIFSGLEQGIYNISVEYYNLCEEEGGLTTVLLQCNDEELNFRCDRWVLGEKEREKALIARDVEELNKANEQEKINKTASSLYQTSNSKTELASSTYFYHWDHLGTARLITDNSGNIVSRHDFEPFGVEIAPYNDTAQNTHKFTGHERDESTGYDYMHFRYYASTFGRFMKPDNVTGSPMNPQNWNLYSYVRGNPVNFNDPSGHVGEKIRRLGPPQGTVWEALANGMVVNESSFGGLQGVAYINRPPAAAVVQPGDPNFIGPVNPNVTINIPVFYDSAMHMTSCERSEDFEKTKVNLSEAADAFEGINIKAYNSGTVDIDLKWEGKKPNISLTYENGKGFTLGGLIVVKTQHLLISGGVYGDAAFGFLADGKTGAIFLRQGVSVGTITHEMQHAFGWRPSSGISNFLQHLIPDFLRMTNSWLKYYRENAKRYANAY